MRDSDMKWLSWLAGLLTVFGVLEYPELRRKEFHKPSGTLTSTFRRWLGMHTVCELPDDHDGGCCFTQGGSWRRHFCVPAFGGFCVWLFGHFCFRWPPR